VADNLIDYIDHFSPNVSDRQGWNSVYLPELGHDCGYTAATEHSAA
jgi:hypothetical protein